MFKNLTKTIFGDPNLREAKRLQPLVDQINALGPEFERMSNDELRAQTDAFRQHVAERVGSLRDEAVAARETWQIETDGPTRAQMKVELDRLERELKEAEADAMAEIL